MRYLKTEDGTAVRVAVRTGAIIPRSDESKLRRKPRPTEAGPADTPADAVTKVTWAGFDAEVETAARRIRLRRALLLAKRQAAAAYKGFVPPTTRNRAPFKQAGDASGRA